MSRQKKLPVEASVALLEFACEQLVRSVLKKPSTLLVKRLQAKILDALLKEGEWSSRDRTEDGA